ncbi:hypothetical protein AVEN_31789-1 [Araneus ventricosus]|uniref:Uncharacterized protein n=1 Tax=Araneus ventricosus TaxID=182803 RepID=A0A4Y2SP77_ARAVE|nr:hypothetical protein AVEN_31789-1 [Araneus ventricosus]
MKLFNSETTTTVKVISQGLKLVAARPLGLQNFTLQHTLDSRGKNLRFPVWMSVRRNFIEQQKKDNIQVFKHGRITCEKYKNNEMSYLQVKRKTLEAEAILRQAPKAHCFWKLVGGLIKVLDIEPLVQGFSIFLPSRSP